MTPIQRRAARGSAGARQLATFVLALLVLVLSTLLVPTHREKNYTENYGGADPHILVGSWHAYPQPGEPRWRWVWELGLARIPWSFEVTPVRPAGAAPGQRTSISWGWMAGQLTIVWAPICLCALGLRLWARRRRAEA